MTVKESRARYHDAVNAYMTAPDTTDARDELAGALLEYRMDCVNLVERLAVTLEPFAAEAGTWHHSSLDHWTPNIGTRPGDDNDASFTVGDLRAIADIYGEVV